MKYLLFVMFLAACTPLLNEHNVTTIDPAQAPENLYGYLK